MLIPNADKAIIAPEKLRDYLLNPAHPRGWGKARLLLGCGYRADAWQVLETDIRTQHLSVDFDAVSDNIYGRRFEIVAPLTMPNGWRIDFRSIWQIDDGTDVPRLITMFPRWHMPFELYSQVILTADLPKEDLKAGDVGTVVPGIEDGYSVEFFDMTGRTVAVPTLGESLLRAPVRSDRPAVRAISSGA
jgi:hypothetical protein